MELQAITRALVIDEPWIGLILEGRKTWEMRSKPTSIRGPFGLIRKGSGRIVGTASLVGCGASLDAAGLCAAADRHGMPEGQIQDATRNRWTVPWQLEDVRAFRAPVRYQHPSGAVTWVKLTTDVQAMVQAARAGER